MDDRFTQPYASAKTGVPEESEIFHRRYCARRGFLHRLRLISRLLDARAIFENETPGTGPDGNWSDQSVRRMLPGGYISQRSSRQSALANEAH